MKARPRLGYESRLALVVFAGAVPAALLAAAALSGTSLGSGPRLMLALAALACAAGAGLAVRARAATTMRSLTTVVASLRDGDYSLQAHATGRDDALDVLKGELNGLAETLREQRLGALEAAALVRVVLEAVDVPVFVFDDHDRLRTWNRAAVHLVPIAAEDRTAEDLAMAALLGGDSPRTVTLPNTDGGPWELRRTAVRLRGRPHQLLALPDLRRALREEERLAWQRLVRVLGHEINNSLAPMKSIAGNLGELVRRSSGLGDLAADLESGLTVINRRAEALGRFLGGYARLAQLPPPTRKPTAIAAFVSRVASLETRIPVIVDAEPDGTVEIDPDQIEQVVINLLRNAAESVLESGRGGRARVRWRRTADRLTLFVEDEGQGLAGTTNLFVPFFTTKPGGSGIGLALSRQIAEAHGGTLTLENRADAPGCVARLSLPLR